MRLAALLHAPALPDAGTQRVPPASLARMHQAAPTWPKVAGSLAQSRTVTAEAAPTIRQSAARASVAREAMIGLCSPALVHMEGWESAGECT